MNFPDVPPNEILQYFSFGPIKAKDCRSDLPKCPTSTQIHGVMCGVYLDYCELNKCTVHAETCLFKNNLHRWYVMLYRFCISIEQNGRTHTCRLVKIERQNTLRGIVSGKSHSYCVNFSRKKNNKRAFTKTSINGPMSYDNAHAPAGHALIPLTQLAYASDTATQGFA